MDTDLARARRRARIAGHVAGTFRVGIVSVAALAAEDHASISNASATIRHRLESALLPAEVKDAIVAEYLEFAKQIGLGRKPGPVPQAELAQRPARGGRGRKV